MVIVNKTNAQVVFLGMINGDNLVLGPHESSNPIIPNKEMLKELLNNTSKVQIIAHSAQELDMISELDSRAVNLITLENDALSDED